MAVKPLSSLPPSASVVGGINGELPVDKTESVFICPYTSRALLLLFISCPFFLDVFFNLSDLCHSFPEQVAVVLTGMLCLSPVVAGLA